jgi:hypothetical protein
MSKETWKIWDKDDSVEQRTYKRVTGELPEMECTKQLVNLVSDEYLPGMSVLDVGCKLMGTVPFYLKTTYYFPYFF